VSCSSSDTGSAPHHPADLERARIPPARAGTPTRRRQFLRAQASTMLACDFFHVDCAVVLQRIYLFFLLESAAATSTYSA